VEGVEGKRERTRGTEREREVGSSQLRIVSCCGLLGLSVGLWQRQLFVVVDDDDDDGEDDIVVVAAVVVAAVAVHCLPFC